jgi:chemotaxis protein MotB
MRDEKESSPAEIAARIAKKKENDFSAMSSMAETEDAMENDWLMTYCDILTLLLAFFIILFSISKVNPEKFQQVSDAVEKQFMPPQDVPTPSGILSLLSEKLEQVIAELNLKKDISIVTSKRVIKMKLSDDFLFPAGSADLNRRAIAIIQRIAILLNTLPFNQFHIVIKGHTDSAPINTSQFPSNWELSASRAIAVLHLFVSDGIPEKAISAEAYGDTRPTEQDKTLPPDPAKDRRVEIYIQEITD